MEVFSEEALRTAPSFKLYEQEEDTTKDLAEFSLANAIFAALVEGHAAEINSKRNAMDNASKNAGDMIQSLNMQVSRREMTGFVAVVIDTETSFGASKVDLITRSTRRLAR